MEHRTLGSTGLQVSPVAFGAGPVSGLMTGSDIERQAAVVRRAIESGINWFDTAATYGAGSSEEALGTALAHLGSPAGVHLATKVRFLPEDLDHIAEKVEQSFAESLARLRVSRVTLVQLHNSITQRRGDEPTSITPEDVLGRRGVLEAFERLREKGLVEHLGLTGIGHPGSLREVVRHGAFATMQIPYHVLNPSAGQTMPSTFAETDYGNVIAACADASMGVFAIRVFAAGALLDAEPSAHTLKTPFFPLELYERDRRRARQLAESLGLVGVLGDFSLRFALCHSAISAAIIGFGEPAHVDAAVTSAAKEPLSAQELRSAAEFLNGASD